MTPQDLADLLEEMGALEVGYAQSQSAARALTRALAQADPVAIAEATARQDAALNALAEAEDGRRTFVERVWGPQATVSGIMEQLCTDDADRLRTARRSLLLAMRAAQDETRAAAAAVQSARTVIGRPLRTGTQHMSGSHARACSAVAAHGLAKGARR